MRARSAAWVGFVSLATASAFAGTSTVNPNSFGNGQVVTAPGVSLETETFVQAGKDSSGNPLYMPKFSSVYSYSMGAGCSGVLCPPVGTNLLAPSPSGALPNTPNFGAGEFWGTPTSDTPALDCSKNCLLNASAAGSVLLRLDFTHPTDFVDALGFINGGDPTEITAFDSAGHIVAQNFNDTTGVFTGWADATVNSSTWDISTVLIGGHDSFRGINLIDFASVPAAPEIDSASAASALTLLLGSLVVLSNRRKIN